MNDWPSWTRPLMTVHLTAGPLHDGMIIATGAGIAALLVWQLTRHDRARLIWQLLGAAIAGAAGCVITWLLSDVVMAFGVSLGWTVIGTITAGIAVLGFLGVTIAHARGLRRAIAIIMIPIALAATALQVDAIYGEYQTIGDLVGYSPYETIGNVRIAKATMSVAQWQVKASKGKAPAMPAQGRMLSVRIPNTASGFKARTALIYLPPAALSPTPPKLPVLILLAGQPGSPGRAMSASGITTMVDDYAAAHHGLAPIVISPDQNGANTHNSLCADTTRYGKAETYLTKDVPDWIRANLPVSNQPSDWAISGFSQGGTCSTQLAPRHPDLFGTFIAVDGERAPTDGSVEQMTADDFAGDRSRYDEQVPVNAIKAHAPSTQAAVLAAGENDPTSVANVKAIGAAAREAGMDVTMLQVPETGHDWHAVNATLEAALPWWCARVGLASTDGAPGAGDTSAGDTSASTNENTKTWADYPRLEVLE